MLSRLVGFVVAALLPSLDAGMIHAAEQTAKFALTKGDVVAFVGGADVVTMGQTGHLESLLVAAYPDLNLRFRNFGWEADTVFEQPRDFGFPPMKEHLKRAGSTVVFFQFGRMESLSGTNVIPRFKAAYRKLITEVAPTNSRVALVIPPRFVAPPPRGSPGATISNSNLVYFVQSIRDLANEQGFGLIDLSSVSRDGDGGSSGLTYDGLQLSGEGHSRVAAIFAQQLGATEAANKAGVANRRGEWSDPAFEALRKAVVEKNRLWFDYWRPQNWAFLGGDRTTQPSSRDHRDPKVRWFPAEMEKFVGLIEMKEKEIAGLAKELSKR